MNAVSFHRVRSLVIKELQALIGDPSSRRILILPVILQVVLFPLAATLEVKNNCLAIYNEDSGAVAVELVQRFATAKAFSTFTIVRSEPELEKAITEQKALLAVHFPEDFSRRFLADRSSNLQVILDGRRSSSGQIAAGYLQTIVQDYLTEVNTSNGTPDRSAIIVRHWFNPNLDYYRVILPSLIANILTIGSLIVTSLSVAREREQGTFDQLLVSPLTSEMIMMGKGIPAMLIATVQATIVFLATVFIYGVDFQGSVLIFYLSMFVYVCALVGIGLLISSICSTQQQAFLGSFCFLMPAILLSGFSAPIDNMPRAFQILTWFNPLTHFIAIARGIFLKDVGLDFIVMHLLPLIGLAAASLGAAAWIFRHRLN